MTTHLTTIQRLVAAGGAFLVLGCREPTVCTMELQFSLTPGDTVIAVGQSFVAQLALGGGCTPLHPVAATWRTLDTAVVFVDATAGRVTGRAVGDARIIAASSSGDFPTTVHVR